MKVLVATAQTQGAREGDFNWCVEGELVWMGLVCSADERDPDGGGCGCARAFGGLNSHLATTTAMVRDILRFSRADYIEAVRSSLQQQGWPSDIAEELADELIELAGFWEPGTVVERRLDSVIVRSFAGQDDR